MYLPAITPVQTMITGTLTANELMRKPVHPIKQPTNTQGPVPYLAIAGVHTNPET